MPPQTQQVPSPPRVVAISGMIFAVLYIVSLVLIRLAVPADPTEPGLWLADPSFRNWVRIALEPDSIHGDRVPLVHGGAA